MINGNSFLAIIPARGGSKGIPKKNIVDLNGMPLISHTFAQVSEVTHIDKCIVSTDSDEIERISLDNKFEVLKRPAAISTDTAKTEEALLHAIEKLESNGEYFDYTIILEPTSPFRKPETISRCMNLIIRSGAKSLLTVKQSYENIGTISEGFFKTFRKNDPRRRQDRAPFYIESSTVYIVKNDFLKASRSIVADQWAACIIDKDECIDINTPLDLKYARFHLGIS